jgi:FAD:protein FMN transferase
MRRSPLLFVSTADAAMTRLLSVLVLVLVLLLVACATRPDRVHVESLGGDAMGSTWTVKLVRTDASPDLATLQAGIQAQLDTVDRQMSAWKPESDLSRFNAAPAGTWQTLPPELFTVLDAALVLARDTDGAYDPTVGPLVNLWGFGPGPKTITIPDKAALAAARARVGWRRIALDRTTQRARQPGGATIDLSSIAPGFAVDQVTRYLERVGIADFLVEHGGELRARGHRPGALGWRVGIEQPDTDDGLALVVVLSDRASGASGDYRKFYEREGRRFSHHIDPRTGAPVTHTLASVTVLAENGMRADATAAALSILGPDAGLMYARRRGIAALFVTRRPDGFTQTMTPGFAAARE